MKLITILTTLAIAGSPAVALADRDRDNSDRRDRYGDRADRTYENTGRDRYDRFDRSRWNREPRGRWVSLAHQYSARTKSQHIVLLGKGGRFDKLRVESDRGAPVISQVTVEFMDNPNPQVVHVNSRLSRGNGEVIRLNGNQRIKRIIVYTEPNAGGAYSVYGA